MRWYHTMFSFLLSPITRINPKFSTQLVTLAQVNLILASIMIRDLCVIMVWIIRILPNMEMQSDVGSSFLFDFTFSLVRSLNSKYFVGIPLMHISSLISKQLRLISPLATKVEVMLINHCLHVYFSFESISLVKLPL